MTHRHIPTLTAVPDFIPEDRRALDRRAPAFIVEERDHTGRITWTVCTRYEGKVREVIARDGMDARRIKALHSSLGTWAPDDRFPDPVRFQIVQSLRDHATDPLATPERAS